MTFSFQIAYREMITNCVNHSLTLENKIAKFNNQVTMTMKLESNPASKTFKSVIYEGCEVLKYRQMRAIHDGVKSALSYGKLFIFFTIYTFISVLKSLHFS